MNRYDFPEFTSDEIQCIYKQIEEDRNNANVIGILLRLSEMPLTEEEIKKIMCCGKKETTRNCNELFDAAMNTAIGLGYVSVKNKIPLLYQYHHGSTVPDRVIATLGWKTLKDIDPDQIRDLELPNDY